MENPEGTRRNLILMVNGKVAGFQSYLLQNNGNIALAQALRVDFALKGQGMGKKFMNLCRDYLQNLNSKMIEVKCVWYAAGVGPSKRSALGELKGIWAETCFEIENFPLFIEKGCQKRNNCLTKISLEELAGYYDEEKSRSRSLQG